jgi:hypothetical protein
VSIDHDGAGADAQEERVLAQLKSVKVDGVGKGRLLLTNQQLEFEKKGGFFSSPHVEFSVTLTAISSAEIDNASNSLLLKWFNENNERMAYRMALPRGDGALNLCRSLNRALDSLRQQQEQRERRTRYSDFLWQTSYNVWVTAGLLVQIVTELMRESWDDVDSLVCQAVDTAAPLGERVSTDVPGQVQALAEAAATRDAPLVLREAVTSLSVLGTSLSNEPTVAGEWRELIFENPHGLNWRDVRYVFLLAGMHKLIALWKEVDETEKIHDYLPGMAKLCSFVAETVSADSTPAGIPVGSDILVDVEALVREIETTLKVNAGTDI